MKHKIKIAILDMYDGEPNQGMRCIIDIVNRFNQLCSFKIFDVRGACEFPSLEKFDIFISTGGPGNPLEGDGVWDKQYFEFLDNLWNWNKEKKRKKYGFFICHSFQMACIHFNLAKITKRKATSFGVMSIHKVNEGINDPVFENLENPYYAIDSRDFQVVQPSLKSFNTIGAKIISLEKIRDHVQYERAIMAIRFSNEMVGVQFHPEADPLSFLFHLKNKEARDKIIKMKGKAKYLKMLEFLVEEDKIYKTNQVLIPNFLTTAINHIYKQKKILSN
jgi:GMP synthase-like glutamine amidotransferase